MSDEPLYCTHCGEEMGDPCRPGCPAAAMDDRDQLRGPYCHTCGTTGAVDGLCVDCSSMLDRRVQNFRPCNDEWIPLEEDDEEDGF